MCDEAMRMDPRSLAKSLTVLGQKICVTRQCEENHAPCGMFLITSRVRKCATRQCVTTQQHIFLFLTILKQKMCIKAVEVDPWRLDDVPDHFKTQDVCDKAVKDDPSSLQYVPDCYICGLIYKGGVI